MSTQLVQGLNIKKQKGVIVTRDITMLNKMYTSIPISPNETADVVVGAFAELDLAVTTEDTIKLASVTTIKEKLLFVTRLSIADDIAGTSQGSSSDVNGFLVKTRAVLNGANSIYEFLTESGAAITKGALVMIDNTDSSRSTLIPFVDTAGNIAVAIALEPATAAAQIIKFRFI
jgi:hypothetical protein